MLSMRTWTHTATQGGQRESPEDFSSSKSQARDPPTPSCRNLAVQSSAGSVVTRTQMPWPTWEGEKIYFCSAGERARGMKNSPEVSKQQSLVAMSCGLFCVLAGGATDRDPLLVEGIPCVAGGFLSASLLLRNRFWREVPTSDFLGDISGDHGSLCPPTSHGLMPEKGTLVALGGRRRSWH